MTAGLSALHRSILLAPKEQRLWPRVLLSTLLHVPPLVLLAHVMGGVPPRANAPTSIQISWREAAPAARAVQWFPQAVSGMSPGHPAATAGDVPAPSHIEADPASGSEADRLTEISRTIARAAGRQESPADRLRQSLPVPAENLGTAAIAPAPASFLDQVKPSETRLADGRIRVVDRWGRVSCAREPAEFIYATGGVMPRLAVSTNCP